MGSLLSDTERLARCSDGVSVLVVVCAHAACELHGDLGHVVDGAEGQEDSLSSRVLSDAQNILKTLELVHGAGESHDTRDDHGGCDGAVACGRAKADELGEADLVAWPPGL